MINKDNLLRLSKLGVAVESSRARQYRYTNGALAKTKRVEIGNPGPATGPRQGQGKRVKTAS